MVGTQNSMYVPVCVPKRPSCTFTKCIRKRTSCTFTKCIILTCTFCNELSQVAHGIGGTFLTPSDFISGTQGSLMSAPTQIYGSASLTPSASHACTPESLDITDLFD